MQDGDAQRINVHVFVYVEASPYGGIVEGIKVLGGVENAEQSDRILVILGDSHTQNFSPWEHSLLPSLQELGHRRLEQPDYVDYSIVR